MECEWTVDETDGCTLKLQCSMKDACEKDECFDLDMLLEKALHAPRYYTDSKLITGPHVNYTDQCTANYGMICPSTEPIYWTDYIPTVNTTPLIDNYIHPMYNTTAYVMYNYAFSPASNWIFTPVFDYIITPTLHYVLGPVWSFIVGAIYSMYEVLPDADMYTLEFFIHFLACVFTVAALVIVLFVYFCYVFTDKAKFGVVTRHPLKETITSSPRTASDETCQPGCTKDHTHRRFSYPPGTLKQRKSSLLSALQRKLKSLAHEEDGKEDVHKRRHTESDTKDDVFLKQNGT